MKFSVKAKNAVPNINEYCNCECCCMLWIIIATLNELFKCNKQFWVKYNTRLFSETKVKKKTGQSDKWPVYLETQFQKENIKNMYICFYWWVINVIYFLLSAISNDKIQCLFPQSTVNCGKLTPPCGGLCQCHPPVFSRSRRKRRNNLDFYQSTMQMCLTTSALCSRSHTWIHFFKHYKHCHTVIPCYHGC